MKDHMEVLRQIARAQRRRAETAEALVAELEAEREKAVVDAIRWAMREGLVRSALAKALEAVKHSPANWHDIYTELLPLMTDESLTPVERLRVWLILEHHEEDAEAFALVDSLMTAYLVTGEPLDKGAEELRDLLFEVVGSWLPADHHIADFSHL